MQNVSDNLQNKIEENCILVVEDDHHLSLAISRCLRRVDRKIKVHWVSNYEEAVEKMQQQKYVMIISDYMLPSMRSGLEVYKQAKFKQPHVPFLLISGVIEVQQYLDLSKYALTPNAFLRKPFTANEFAATVDAHLRSGGQNRAA